MVSLAMTLAALNSWTYLGFLAPPLTLRSKVSAAAIQPPSRSEPAPTLAQAEPPGVTAPREPAKLAPVVEPARPTTHTPAPTGVRYRLADLTGQLWEHSDPTWLQEFVQTRNQQLLGFAR